MILKQARGLLACGALIAAMPFAFPLTADGAEWLDDLRSGDTERMSHARQVAPFDGAAYLDKVLELVEDRSSRVGRTAELIARDIAAESTAPGREADREVAMRAIEAFLRDARTVDQKIAGLRLFARTARHDHDVSAVSILLEDEHPGVRGRAREALEELGTEPARAALRQLLRDGAMDDRVAAARSLAMLDDVVAEPMVRALMDEAPPHARAQAAIALAEITDPGALGDLLDLWQAAEGDTRRLAAAAVLRLAQRAEGSGAAPRAREAYRALLGSGGPGDSVAAAAGLARVGTEEDARALGDLVRGDDDGLRLVALAALGRIGPSNATDILVDCYDGLALSEKPLALRALRQRADDRAAGLFEREALGATGAIQREAVESLGDIPSPRAVDALARAVASDDEEVAASARPGLLRVGEALSARGEAEAAARAFLLVAESTDASLEERRRALSGMMENPDPGSLELVLGLAEYDELASEVSVLMVLMAAQAEALGDMEAAAEARVRAFALDDSLALRQRYIAAAEEAGLVPDTNAILAPVRHWDVIGPFPAESVTEEWDTEHVDPKAIDTAAPVDFAGETLHWQRLEGEGPFAVLDLYSNLAQATNCFAYAHARVLSPRRQLAQVRLGSDDGATVWLNGWRVHDNRVDRGVVFDSDVVPIRLEEGTNEILVRISQGGGGWAFALRLTDRQGNGLDLEEVFE